MNHKPVRIAPGILIIDLGLYLQDHGVLVLGDFHIGYEDSLISRGVLVPRFQTAQIIDRVQSILSSLPGPIETVVINGDLKHEFGSISNQEWKGILKLVDVLQSKAKSVLIVKGNHDVVIGPVAKKAGVEVVAQARFGKVLVAHGDEVCSLAGADTVIIGHEHPAVSVRDGARVERFKCFLKGSFRSKTLIAMPSFQLATQGTDVLFEKTLSPFLKGDLSEFEVFIVEDEVYRFGTVAKLADLS